MHECALGLALFAVGPIGVSGDFHHPWLGGSVVATGAYFLVKDWAGPPPVAAQRQPPAAARAPPRATRIARAQ